MSAKTIFDYVKILKSINLGNSKSKIPKEKGYARSHFVYQLLKKYDAHFTVLQVASAKDKATIFSFMEEDIIEPLDSSVPAKANDDAWKELRRRIKVFYQVELHLKDMARRKLAEIKQEQKTAHELLHEIVELYEIAAYTDDIEQLKELIRDRFIKAIDDRRVTAQVDLHDLPGATKLTVDQICEYTYILQKTNPPARANRVTAGSRGRGGQSNASNKCTGCGQFNHQTGAANCPAKGRDCYKCGRYNHFGDQCMSAPTRGRGNTRGRGRGYQGYQPYRGRGGYRGGSRGGFRGGFRGGYRGGRGNRGRGGQTYQNKKITTEEKSHSEQLQEHSDQLALLFENHNLD